MLLRERRQQDRGDPVAISFTNRAGDNFDMVFVKVLGHTGGAVIFHGKASVDTNGRFIANALCDTGGGCAAPDPFRLMLSGRLSSDGGAIDVTLQAVGCFANGAGEPDACAFPELGFVNVRAVPCE
jgi:hypothetical protein